MNPGHTHDRFPATHWSMVLEAAGAEADPEACAAWEELCRGYWHPLYAFIRREGRGPEDAQDLAQEFLARLIQRRHLAGVEREGGRFRSFLLARLKHFLADERKRDRAQQRGGGRPLLSLDEDGAESGYRLEAADSATPEQAFERQCALALTRRALERLEAQYAARGRAEVFAALKPCLSGAQAAVSCAALGARLGLSEEAVKTAVHRLRRDFGGLLRAEVARTVAHPAEVDAELRRLIEVTAGVPGGL